MHFSPPGKKNPIPEKHIFRKYPLFVEEKYSSLLRREIVIINPSSSQDRFLMTSLVFACYFHAAINNT